MFKSRNYDLEEESRENDEHLKSVKLMRNLVQIAFLAVFLIAAGLANSPLHCAVTGSGETLAVSVTIAVPHPGEMVINTPDGRTIWLQADHIPFLYPVTDDFQKMSSFVLRMQNRGSWFNDWGEPEAVSILSVDGTYRIVIADDIESRRNHANTYTCEFSVITSES